MDRWLRNVNVIRVVAVLLGVLLWVIVRLDVENSAAGTQPSTVSEKYTDVSISVVGLDENRYSLTSINPEKVNLEVSGTASAVRRISTRNYEVVLDLSGAEPGEQLVRLRHTGFPSGVEVNIDPPSVYVSVEEKQRKEVPVTIKVKGSPSDGYKTGEPIVEPNRVNVMVSGTLAKEIDSVIGEISVEGATATVKEQVKLVAVDKEGKPLAVAVSPPVVDVEVPVTSPFKTVPLQIKLSGTPPPGLAVGSFEQSVSEVTVYGPQAYLNSLEFYDGLNIDLSALTETTDFEFAIPLKEGVEKVNPDTVTARVTIVQAVSATLNDVPLSINGKSEDYSYRLVSPADPTFNVSVEAAPDIVANLTAQDVKAIVNVNNMPPGIHELPVEYTLPSFVKTIPGNVNYVTVEIKSKADSADADVDQDDQPVGTVPSEEPSQGGSDSDADGTPPDGQTDSNDSTEGADTPPDGL